MIVRVYVWKLGSPGTAPRPATLKDIGNPPESGKLDDLPTFNTQRAVVGQLNGIQDRRFGRPPTPFIIDKEYARYNGWQRSVERFYEQPITHGEAFGHAAILLTILGVTPYHADGALIILKNPISDPMTRNLGCSATPSSQGHLHIEAFGDCTALWMTGNVDVCDTTHGGTILEVRNGYVNAPTSSTS